MFFFFQAEDGIRDLVRSRGLGDVYKRQPLATLALDDAQTLDEPGVLGAVGGHLHVITEEALSLIHI